MNGVANGAKMLKCDKIAFLSRHLNESRSLFVTHFTVFDSGHCMKTHRSCFPTPYNHDINLNQ